MLDLWKCSAKKFLRGSALTIGAETAAENILGG